MPASSAAAWVQSATVPAVTTIRTGIPWASTAGCGFVSAPFSAADGLIAAPGANAVLVYLDLTGVNHQPLKVRVVNQGCLQFGPDALIAPADKAAAVDTGALLVADYG